MQAALPEPISEQPPPKPPRRGLKWYLNRLIYQLPLCQHPSGRNESVCARCQGAMCRWCSFSRKNSGPICFYCVDDMHRTHWLRFEMSSMFSGSILADLPKTQLTLFSIAVLAAFYFVSAFPDLSQITESFFDNVDGNIFAIALEHEYWRIATSILYHKNLQHLGSNLFGLFLFGHLTEIRIGPKVLAAWMIASALGAKVLSFIFVPWGSIGFSGVTSGLEVAYITLLSKIMLTYRFQDTAHTMRTMISLFILIILINLSSDMGVNIFAHFGGAIVGLICAALYPVRCPWRLRDTLTLSMLIGLLVAMIVGIIALYAIWYG